MTNRTLVLYRAFSDAAGKGAFLLITVLAARLLTRGEFGLFSLGTTLGWLAGVAADAGVQLHVARAIAQQPERAATIVVAWGRLRVATTGAAAVAIGGGLLLAGVSADAAFPLLAFATLYLINGLVEFFYYVFRGFGRSDLESSLTLAQRLSTLAVAALVLAWYRDLVLLAAAMVAPAVVTLTVAARHAARLAQPSERTGREAAERATLAELWPAFRREALPIGIGVLLSALYFRIDILLLELWAGIDAVALYNAVFRLIEALRLFPAAVLAVALPDLCRAETGAPAFRLSAGLAAFGAVVAAALIGIGPWLVPAIYGAAYSAAVPAFQILAAAFPLMAVNFALTHQLVGWHRHRAYAMIGAGALVFNVVMNARLIPALSLTGAAWATLWTEVFLTAGCLLALRGGAATAALQRRREVEAS
jgi:O-antigen/teichoic acid export membrane protein